MNETELAFCEILNCGRASLYRNKNSLLEPDEYSRISSALRRRARGEPLQYILGRTEFFGLDFKVSPDVLIPRPETEVLVETTLKIVRKSFSPQVRKLKILDVGTGSGCIAVSLAKALPQAEISATDISAKALAAAKENAALNKVKINFIKADLFRTLDLSPLTFDLITSNPPYIPGAEIAGLQPEIQYEPTIALDGGRDGLDFYRRIVKDAAGYLADGGFLIMEMGYGQAKAVKNILLNSGNFEIIESARDYHNIERVAVAKKSLWIS